jgi:hypothetical protein
MIVVKGSSGTISDAALCESANAGVGRRQNGDGRRSKRVDLPRRVTRLECRSRAWGSGRLMGA